MTKLGVPTLLGIPFDANSSYLRGPGDAPLEIRKALHCEAYNQWTELGVDLGATGAYEDAGDLKLADNDAFQAIEAGVEKLLRQGKRPVSLGATIRSHSLW
jgi:arginase family enzyme